VQATVRQQDARRVHCEPLSDQLAERRVPGRGAVREDRLPVAREDGCGAVGELLEREQIAAERIGRQIDGRGQALHGCKT